MLQKSRCILLYFILTELIGILLFINGFFPNQSVYTHSTMDSFPSQINKIRVSPAMLYKRQKPLLVIMVIDALRYDFVDGINSKQYMPYLSSQLGKHINCLLKSRVEPPTVTLPRIKALVTGAIPSFYDVISNFGSIRLEEDNFLAQARLNKMNINFYGDETWLKLFPDLFLRSEGTTSFFVSDFTEVDNNVTRHLDEELNKTDWDILILHYLGLDHIGHLEGPFSEKIKPKLLEMDQIVEKINNQLMKRNPENPGVLLICGDHGMKDSGGHGGTSLSEVLVPVALLNYKCDQTLRNKEVKQVDVTPLLSILLGLPIPGGSVGTLNLKLLTSLEQQSAIYAVYYNSFRMMNLFRLGKPAWWNLLEPTNSMKEGTDRYERWIHNKYSSDNYDKAAFHLYEAQQDMASQITRSRIRYDTYFMIAAMILFLQVIFHLLHEKWEHYQLDHIKILVIGYAITMIIHYNVCLFLNYDSNMCQFMPFQFITSAIVIAIIIINLWLFVPSVIKLTFQPLLTNSLIVGSGTLLQLIALTTTSLIEEEHQLWYFLMTTLLLKLLTRSKPDILLLLLLQTFLRKLNQTGDKYSHLPDLGDWLNLGSNKLLLSIFYIAGLGFAFYFQMNKGHTHKNLFIRNIEIVLILVQACSIYLYKAATGACISVLGSYASVRGITEVKLFWTLLFARNILNIISMHPFKMLKCNLYQQILSLMIINTTSLIILLLKPHNVYLVPAIILFSDMLSNVFSNHCSTLAIIHQWIGCTFYFFQGNSNSIANIDVTPGYTGLTEYNPLITGFFIFIHTFSGPIMSYLLLMKQFVDSNISFTKKQIIAYKMILLVNTVTTGFYMIIITVQKHHLFIWSVFAPKLLFLAAQTSLLLIFLFFNILIIVLLEYLQHSRN